MRLLALLVLCALPAAAQPAPPIGSASPAADLRVAYAIDARLDAGAHRLAASQEVTLYNQSPDTLRQAYFHLYFNAFDPASAMAERNRHLPDPDPRVVPRVFELGPDEVGWTRVGAMAQDGRPVAFEVTGTVLRATLPAPLPPGVSTTLTLDWTAQVPLQTRRSGRDSAEGIDFSMAQWYPKLANYDAAGWHPDPYIGREFYAPFGTFDVRLTVPSAYVVAATGVLQNPTAVGHGYDAPLDAGPTRNGPAPVHGGGLPDSLTYHFRAEDVHDFAWSADPDYVHERVAVRGAFADDTTRVLPVHLFYQPEVASRWERLPAQIGGLVAAFNALGGPYPYPQFTVAQGGDGGMEYPMITLITGRRSPGSVLGVTAHELGHMWYYGVLGTNEARHAWMDEGFTGWLEAEAMHLMAGRPGRPSHAGALLRLLDADRAGLREPIDYRSDWYATNHAYNVASYSGGQAFLHVLGGVIGDSLRDATLHAYFREWAFRHPGPDDFQRVAEATSGLELGWFFDQFLRSTAEYAYALRGMESTRSGTGWTTQLHLVREADGVMPLDVALELEDGSWALVHVPVDAALGHRPLNPGEVVVPPVPWPARRFSATVTLPARPVQAVLDPFARLLEVDRLDNRVVRVGLDVPLAFGGWFRPPPPRWDRYGLSLAPVGGYSSLYGWGGGLQFRGTAVFGRHEVQAAAEVWPQVLADPDRGAPATQDVSDASGGTAWNALDYTLRYRTPLSPRTDLDLGAEKHLGILENRAGVTFALGRWPTLQAYRHAVTLSASQQYRVTDAAFRAPGVASEPAPVFAAARAGVTGFARGHTVSARLDWRLDDGTSWLRVGAETGAAGADGRSGSPARSGHSANRVWLDTQRAFRLGAATLAARGFAGTGSDELVAQKQFRLGAVPVEDRWRAASYRWPAAAMDDPLGDAHFAAFSGVGPVAYLLGPGAAFGSGTRVVSGSLSLGVPIPRFEGMDHALQAVLAPFRLEAFSGAGQLWSAGDRTGWLADAGVAATYDLGRLAPLFPTIAQSDVLRGLRLAARFPVWVSKPEQLGPDERALAFRWLLGVGVGV